MHQRRAGSSGGRFSSVNAVASLMRVNAIESLIQDHSQSNCLARRAERVPRTVIVFLTCIFIASLKRNIPSKIVGSRGLRQPSSPVFRAP